jgi:curved DNA-binding protein CbpA
MASTPPDPYVTLGVTPAATDEELRTAYRRLVQRHHPDHNNGSRESALRFAEVQEAYAHVKLLRKQAGAPAHASGSGHTAAGAAGGAPPSADPDLDARLAQMDRELRTAREQREHAARAAAKAAARASQKANRPSRKPGASGADDGSASDEELGYISTDDSFSKILDDFADQVSSRFSEAHPPPGEHRAQSSNSGQDKGRRPRSIADWIDELGSRLTGDGKPRDDD